MSLSVTAMYCLSEAQASVITDKVYETGISRNIFALRFEAISWVETLLMQLYSRYEPEFVDEIARQKLAFAKTIFTTKDLSALKTCSTPRWDYGGYHPGSKYFIPEEELLFWSRMSEQRPLNGEQIERWCQVMKEAHAKPIKLLQEMGL